MKEIAYYEDEEPVEDELAEDSWISQCYNVFDANDFHVQRKSGPLKRCHLFVLAVYIKRDMGKGTVTRLIYFRHSGKQEKRRLALSIPGALPEPH